MFAIWRACLRVGIRPPGVQENWEDNGAFTQALILAFDQVCNYDEAEQGAASLGMSKPSPTAKRPSKSRKKRR